MFFDLFSDFFESGVNVFVPAPASLPNITCPTCHMTLGEFAKTGKLGCSDCYEAFRPQLVQVLKSVHGNAEHIGKTPENVSEKLKIKREHSRLKSALDAAVAAENFEEAAALRDRVRDLERQEGMV